MFAHCFLLGAVSLQPGSPPTSTDILSQSLLQHQPELMTQIVSALVSEHKGRDIQVTAPYASFEISQETKTHYVQNEIQSSSEPTSPASEWHHHGVSACLKHWPPYFFSFTPDKSNHYHLHPSFPLLNSLLQSRPLISLRLSHVCTRRMA